MMHQEIESNTILDTMLDTVSRLTMSQATTLLNLLGTYDRDEFNLTGTTYGWSLRNFVGYNYKRRMDIIPVTFEGGPTGHKQFKGSLSTFVADRILYSIKSLGIRYVRNVINDILRENENEYYAG